MTLQTRRKVYVSIPISISFCRDIVKGILMFCKLHPEWWPETGSLSKLVEQPSRTQDYAGLIVFMRDIHFPEVLRLPEFPVVNCSSFESQSGLPRVATDNREIGRMAARHLLSKGYRQHVVLMQVYRKEGTSSFAESRLAGYREELSQTPGTHLTIRTFPGTLHDLPPAPFALFCMKDELAIQAMYQLQDQGLSIPSDVVVLGVDNDELICETAPVTLSSLELRAQNIGYAAMEQLALADRGGIPDTYLQELPPVKIVERESTRYFSSQNPEVGFARRYIEEHALNPQIHIPALVDQLPISRRTLERRFREEVGHSLLEEIQRVRIDHAKLLLRETGLGVAEIAWTCGMQDVRRFSELFKRREHVTPSRFRSSLPDSF